MVLEIYGYREWLQEKIKVCKNELDKDQLDLFTAGMWNGKLNAYMDALSVYDMIHLKV